VSQQLQLFPESREERLEREVESLRKDLSTLRRGLFARHSELSKKYQETIYEFEMLKGAICKSKSLNTTLQNQVEPNLKDLFMYSYRN
jgi:hypothetical protein